MADNTQKTPLARSLIQLIESQIASATQQNPQSLPCSVVAINGAMVTVKFEITGPISFPQITVPQAISRYARPPTQIGDKGMVIASDLYLGGVTGLGGGTANYLRKESNLSTLVFVPLSNTNFPKVDQNAYNITAPNGAVIKDDSGNSIITLTPSSITLSCGGHSVVIDSSGVKIDGRLFLTHTHSGVTAGGSNTGGVV
jgi:hypothetical protein